MISRDRRVLIEDVVPRRAGRYVEECDIEPEDQGTKAARR